MTKITKRDMFNRILAITTDSEIVDFVNHEIELLDRKRMGSDGKPSKVQRENAKLADKLYAQIDLNPHTVGEIIKSLDFEVSSQKCVALCKMLIADKRMTRNEVKGKAIFTKVA